MRLLTINDTGVGDELVHVELTRNEVEILFMFTEQGMVDTDRRLADLITGPTTQSAAQALQANMERYKYLRDMLDGILRLWEINEDGDEPLPFEFA